MAVALKEPIAEKLIPDDLSDASVEEFIKTCLWKKEYGEDAKRAIRIQGMVGYLIYYNTKPEAWNTALGAHVKGVIQGVRDKGETKPNSQVECNLLMGVLRPLNDAEYVLVYDYVRYRLSAVDWKCFPVSGSGHSKEEQKVRNDIERLKRAVGADNAGDLIAQEIINSVDVAFARDLGIQEPAARGLDGAASTERPRKKTNHE